jgi:hypothetical protein
VPPPAPPVRAAAAVGGADLEAARAMMPQIYQLARQRVIQTGALVNSGCDIIEATESELVFGFRFENHAKRMQESANLTALTEAASEALGRVVTVRCVHDAGVGQWQQRNPPRSSLVRAAQELGARVLAKDEDEA